MSGLVHIQRAGGRKFQIVGAATLKLWAPNEVWTNEMESRLAFDDLRELTYLVTLTVIGDTCLHRFVVNLSRCTRCHCHSLSLAPVNPDSFSFSPGQIPEEQ